MIKIELILSNITNLKSSLVAEHKYKMQCYLQKCDKYELYCIQDKGVTENITMLMLQR